MCSFGLSFSGDFSGMGNAPKGFAPARLTLGSFSERVFSDQAIWSATQYSRHWRETARRCVEGDAPVLFCSSLSRDGVDVWVGARQGENVRFYSLMTQMARLNIDGPTVTPKTSFAEFLGEPSPEWSTWEVPVSYLQCLAVEA